MMRVQRIDGRMNGHGVYQYRAAFGHDKRRYIAVQDWCWETFGPGIELAFFDLEPDRVWAWDYDAIRGHTRCFIYFKGHEQLTLFLLRWGAD